MKIIGIIWLISIVSLLGHAAYVDRTLKQQTWLPHMWGALTLFFGPLVVLPYLFDYFYNTRQRLFTQPSLPLRSTSPVVLSVKRKPRGGDR